MGDLTADGPVLVRIHSECFTGEVLPKGFKLWSKAGWTSTVYHDVAWIQAPDGREYVWAIFTKGHPCVIVHPSTLAPALIALGASLRLMPVFWRVRLVGFYRSIGAKGSVS